MIHVRGDSACEIDRNMSVGYLVEVINGYQFLCHGL